jgi:CDP-glucose 4,6-dehydratase
VENMVNPSPAFWAGKRVLLTGHTGFKGAWLALWLKRLGANVTGVSLAANTPPNLCVETGVEVAMAASYLCDIRDAEALGAIVKQTQPEIVLHLAAQALVLEGYDAPLATFDTNVMGTANLLEAVRGCDAVRVIVAVTTDKVYENKEHARPFDEMDRLGGRDPYSASKAACELVIASYRDSFLREQGVALASARAGNVIGGGDWCAHRLIPDAVRAWGAGSALAIRRPDAVRPWQHVLEPLSAYLQLAERLFGDASLAQPYNFGPKPQEAATVREVITLAQSAFGRGEVVWGDATIGAYEAKWLALETAKAKQILGIEPRWALEQGVTRTMQWFKQHLDGVDALALCEADIAAFESAAS